MKQGLSSFETLELPGSGRCSFKRIYASKNSLKLFLTNKPGGQEFKKGLRRALKKGGGF
jgi:hypothetical protein